MPPHALEPRVKDLERQIAELTEAISVLRDTARDDSGPAEEQEPQFDFDVAGRFEAVKETLEMIIGSIKRLDIIISKHLTSADAHHPAIVHRAMLADVEGS